MNSGREYVDFVQKHWGGIASPNYAVKKANQAWEAWEKQGMTKSSDIDEVISNPDIIFRSYYHDIAKANAVTKDNMFFCYARTGDLNASASTTKNGDHVVIFDSKFHMFINELIITAIVCVYGKPSDSEVDFYFNHLFNELLVFKGRPPYLPKTQDRFMKIITKDYDLTMLGSYCGAAIFSFVICHEIAHHILGHTSKSKKMALQNNNGDEIDLEVDDVGKREEYEADAFGYKLYSEVVKNYDSLENLKLNKQFLSVPLAFFLIADIVELIFPSKSATHPPANKRLAHSEKIKNKLKLDEDLEFYDALREFFAKYKRWCLSQAETQNPR